MKYGKIDGLTHEVSRIVLGSMVFSTSEQGLTNDLLDRFVQAGGNCVDSAHVYGGGDCERALGVWMAERRNRDKILVLDKGAHPDSRGPRVTPESIQSDINDSLERLQTDYIDLYLLHRDDPNIPVAVIVEFLNELKRKGTIRAFGGSNWTVERLQEANAYATAHNLTPFVASSPHLSLGIPNEPMWSGCLLVDAPSYVWYEKSGFPLFSWSSQAHGFFSERYAPDTETSSDVARVYYSERNWERLRRAKETAEAHGASATAIALAYLFAQPLNLYPIIGPRKVEELEDSLCAQDIRLTDLEVRYLEA